MSSLYISWLRLYDFKFSKFCTNSRRSPHSFPAIYMKLFFKPLYAAWGDINRYPITKAMSTFWILFQIWLDPSGWKYLGNKNTCCLAYTANTMSVDALETLGARYQEAWYLPPKSEYSVSRIRRVKKELHKSVGMDILWKIFTEIEYYIP